LIDQTTFAPRLLGWYARHKRDLPWRHTRDPYLIWLSEVILQQTRVKQGLPYYLAFAERFPTVFDLARAEEQEVLRLWQGLGYYSRARNLQHTARLVADGYGGRFPDNYQGLLQLKGIGPYTAAAIASFAFLEPVGVLDGNVYRVLSRLHGIETDIADPDARKVFAPLANRLVSREAPDLYNQAIMEFGALLCTPVSPQCMFCAFNGQCEAFLTGRQHQLPVKSKKAPVRNRYFHYIVFRQDGRVGMRKREAKDIWQGLYDFYLVEAPEALETEELWQKTDLLPWLPALTMGKISPVLTHQLTHQKVFARFWQVDVSDRVDGQELALKCGIAFFEPTQIHALPKPVMIDNYLKTHLF
jgi:A/G-specific adenine glycosylase